MNYYKALNKAIEDGETRDVVKLTQAAIAELYPPERILSEGLIKGIEGVAEKFREAELLVPEVILSTRAVQAGLKTVKPYLESAKKNDRIKVMIGTVSGDLHDIGKNIIKIIVSTLGVEIIDLGIDVSAEKFVQGVKRERPQILMMSALLTTTISQMGTVIKYLEKEGLRKELIIFVGGAPVSDVFAHEIGADYTTPDAEELREILEKICKTFKIAG
ncbi:MAG: cobalamin-dependent protein [Eubacterium sp.]